MKPRLAAALGDDLQAPLDEASPHHWRDLGDFDVEPALPDGAQAAERISCKAPAALARRLAMTGLVFPDQGAALQAQLKPGQRLVSARGDLWRWDGYVASADAPSACRHPPVAAQSPRRAGKPRSSSAKEVRADRFRRLFRRQGRAPSRARSRCAPPKHEERAAEQALIAAQDQATRAARAAAERASPAGLAGSGNPPPDPVGAKPPTNPATRPMPALDELGDGIGAARQTSPTPAARPPKRAPQPAKRAPRWMA